jgi:hypothetical protein
VALAYWLGLCFLLEDVWSGKGAREEGGVKPGVAVLNLGAGCHSTECVRGEVTHTVM